jgi:hypothetical protein
VGDLQKFELNVEPMTVKTYLLSVPERLVRAVLGLSAGVAKEASEIAIPEPVRRSQLYQNLVDTTLTFLIEQVGGAQRSNEGEAVPDDFLVRRAAGNAVELLGIVAFRASPVWVLAALADVCGMGRHLIPEIADALKAQGLLEREAEFTSVDEMLDGLERTSSRVASTINTPPLDVAGLRKEWAGIRDAARGLQPSSLPSADTLTGLWSQLKSESAKQNRTVFETSSMMAVSAVRSVPEGFKWLSASTRVGAKRTGQVFAATLLDHYRQTLGEIQQTGYATYAIQQLRPYVSAAANQFSPKRQTFTEQLVNKVAAWRSSALPQQRLRIDMPGAAGGNVGGESDGHQHDDQNASIRKTISRPDAE